jgi:hypothetical protein
MQGDDEDDEDHESDDDDEFEDAQAERPGVVITEVEEGAVAADRAVRRGSTLVRLCDAQQALLHRAQSHSVPVWSVACGDRRWLLSDRPSPDVVCCGVARRAVQGQASWLLLGRMCPVALHGQGARAVPPLHGWSGTAACCRRAGSAGLG